MAQQIVSIAHTTVLETSRAGRWWNTWPALTNDAVWSDRMAGELEAQPRSVVTKKDARSAGLKRYFTGKPCKHGHTSERYVSGGECVACNDMKRPLLADWARGYAQEWRAKNRDRVCGYTAKWRSKNPGHGASYMAARREIDREGLLALERARYAKNPEKFRAKNRAFLRANKALVATYARNRRALKSAAEGNHTKQQIIDLFAKQRGRCANCSKSIRAGYHADHIKPLSSGGSNWIRNIQLLCQTCNLTKGAKDPIAFARMQGRLV